MLSKQYMGWGAILLAVVMAVVEMMGLTGSLTYLWALIVLVWGVMALKGK